MLNIDLPETRRSSVIYRVARNACGQDSVGFVSSMVVTTWEAKGKLHSPSVLWFSWIENGDNRNAVPRNGGFKGNPVAMHDEVQGLIHKGSINTNTVFVSSYPPSLGSS